MQTILLKSFFSTDKINSYPQNTQMIPLFDLKLSKKIESQILKEIKTTIESNTFILGNNVESFEKSFSKYLGVKFSVGVANGTDALTLALKALDIKKGDKARVRA